MKIFQLVRIALNDMENALTDSNKAISLQPDSADLYTNRGFIYHKTGKLQEALSDFDKALLLNPMDAKAYYSRGIIRYESRDVNGSISDFTKAIEIDNRMAKAYYSIGMAQAGIGEKEKSCLSLKQADRLGYEAAKSAIAQYCGK